MWCGRQLSVVPLMTLHNRLNSQFYGRSLTLEKANLAVQLCSQGMRVPEASECDGDLCRLCKVALGG